MTMTLNRWESDSYKGALILSVVCRSISLMGCFPLPLKAPITIATYGISITVEDGLSDITNGVRIFGTDPSLNTVNISNA